MKKNILIILPLLLLSACHVTELTDSWPVQKRRHMPGWHAALPGNNTTIAPEQNLAEIITMTEVKMPSLNDPESLDLNDLQYLYPETRVHKNLHPPQAPDPAPPDSSKGFESGDEDMSWDKKEEGKTEEKRKDKHSKKMGWFPLFSLLFMVSGLFFTIFYYSAIPLLIGPLCSLIFLVFGFYYMGKDYGREHNEYYYFSHFLLWLSFIVNALFLYVFTSEFF